MFGAICTLRQLHSLPSQIYPKNIAISHWVSKTTPHGVATANDSGPKIMGPPSHWDAMGYDEIRWFPSGLTIFYGKSLVFMGSMNSMAIFYSKLLVYQRLTSVLTGPKHFQTGIPWPGHIDQLAAAVKDWCKEASDIPCGGWYRLVMTNIAMGNDPFIDGLPIRNGGFPWLC